MKFAEMMLEAPNELADEQGDDYPIEVKEVKERSTGSVIAIVKDTDNGIVYRCQFKIEDVDDL